MSFQKQLQNFFPAPTSLLDKRFVNHACVAIVLKGSNLDDLEVGFIRRALRDTDRWSGQIAFPGGKAEPEDPDDIATALRETYEEIGLSLSRDEHIGQLNDIQARRAGNLLEFFIRPFIFFREPTSLAGFETVLDPHEVADFFWVPLEDLRDLNRRTEYELTREQISVKLPAIQMATEPPLWGLTLMMAQELLLKIKKP